MFENETFVAFDIIQLVNKIAPLDFFVIADVISIQNVAVIFDVAGDNLFRFCLKHSPDCACSGKQIAENFIFHRADRFFDFGFDEF